ncbi:MAG: hypothetical protein NC206_08595 [Bacteroides sp.]|nr:hypothetical protein [Roseburia sp.]MCM1347128.1 hypothetical protein [Bacteroides sp.]MCM1421635.1 hypothetical protein [Bacteroides sp.]
MKYILFLLYLLVLQTAFCQNTDDRAKSTENVIAYIKHAMLFNMSMPQEKVYLHFDNTGYFKGEHIWYKAYVVRADNGMPTNISKVLYVELVSPNGDIVKTQKLRIDKGEAHGDLLLDDILSSGFYEVRAYTRYMTNWGGESLFSRVFPVFRSPKNKGNYSGMVMDSVGHRHRLPDYRQKDGETSGSLNVRFYPEGGSLVEGNEGRVAFTVTDSEGRRVDAQGVLVDSCDRSICKVSVSDGRGIFGFTPQGTAARLRLFDKSGKELYFPLPASLPNGCTLSVDAVSPDSVTATVRASTSMHGRLIGYVLMHSGNILECDTMTAAGFLRRSFLRATLPEGVSQFTVFDSSGHILAERLFFVNHTSASSDIVAMEAKADKLVPCGKVCLSLTSSPDASLSVSAMDVASMPCGKYGNIRTWMLLSSDVKGYIERPEYYFESDDEEHRCAADTLMLIQGWRRYDWQLMSGQKSFDNRIQPVEDKLYLFGQLRRVSGNAVDNVSLKAFLYNKKGESLKGSAVTDSLGNYAFELPDISAEWNLQLFTSKQDRRTDYRITIDRRFSPERRRLNLEELLPTKVNGPNLSVGGSSAVDIPDGNCADSLSLSGNHILPTVKVKGRYFTNDDVPKWYDESFGSHYASVYYNCEEVCDSLTDEGKDIPLLYEWLISKNEFISGTDIASDVLLCNPDGDVARPVDFTKDGILKTKATGADRFTDLDPMYSVAPPAPWLLLYADGLSYRNRPVVWIVNNTYCTITGFTSNKLAVDYCNNYVNAIAMPQYLNEVKSVYFTENTEVLSSYLLSGSLDRVHPVVAYIYTIPVVTTESRKGLRSTYFQGFNVPSTFQMEDYSVLPAPDDFRRTIYWNPDVRTDKDGKATVEFYNNSTCTQMYISAEGMTRDGQFVTNE